MEIKKVGVVGCGLMGSGIAQVCAQAGYPTVVSEINDALLNKGLDSIKSNLEKTVAKGKMSEGDKDAILGRLKGTTNMDDFKDCDFVIEAAFERMEIKEKTFASLDNICPKHAILATNTSTMSVIHIAAATKRMPQVVGTHFFNPVPVMRLVEVVRTVVSSDESVDTAKKFGESLGKTVILAKDTPGFIVNRILIPFLFDAVRVYESGIASKEDIDNGMVLGCNHPIGPLALIDLAGLDVGVDVGNSLYKEFKEARFAPPTLLRKMVAAGHLGRKSGKGFYDYK